MNRRLRRAAGQRQAAAKVGRASRCQDCDSEVDVVEVAPRVFEAFVRHDDTCPWLADFQRRGGHGIRFYRQGD